jgi:hypothetical protein
MIQKNGVLMKKIKFKKENMTLVVVILLAAMMKVIMKI